MADTLFSKSSVLRSALASGRLRYDKSSLVETYSLVD
jgi:hypothetical protein